jgi:hypothetical protein
MRSIHFHVELILARECYEDCVFDIVLVERVTNVADVMTKVLGKELHSDG